MTSLTKGLVSKSTGYDIKYKELVHNAPAVAQNAAISSALKAKNNVLQVITVLVIPLQLAVPTIQWPICCMLYFRYIYALVIKQVHIHIASLRLQNCGPSWLKPELNNSTSHIFLSV